MGTKFRPMDFVAAILIAIVVVLVFRHPFSSSQSALKYYGHYFVEDPDKDQQYVGEVKDFTNLINMRYDNGANNSWDYEAAGRVKNAGAKVMLQVPFGTDWDQTVFVDASARSAYLNKIKQDMLNTDFLPSLAYFAVYEEWYILISQGFYDKWPIFQNRTKEQKFAIAKSYLEQIINDVHNTFPGIPVIIVDDVSLYPPPSNLDVLGVDAYYIPDNQYCDQDQRDKFNSAVLPAYDAVAPYQKPIMMVAPSFIGGPWKMLSECQMQWYADLAVSGTYSIESFLWFFYADTGGFIGVRNYPDLVYKQKSIGCQILGDPYCVVPPPPPPPPPPPGPVAYTVNLQANNGQYVVAEGNGGGVVNANRTNAGAWETFTLVDVNGDQLVAGDKVGLKTSSDYYFRAEGGGGSSMSATPRSMGTFETFTIEKAGGGAIENGNYIFLRTGNGTNFVVAEGGGGREVAANRTAAYAWETFGLKMVGQSPPPPPPPGPVAYTVNLQANNGQYVVAEGNGGGVVNANRTNAGAWETFILTDLNGGQLVNGDQVNFKTSSDYYFMAEGGGGSTMDATARSVGPWETYVIQDPNGGTIMNGDPVSIRTWNGTNFVVAEGGGGREVAANRAAAYAWETFTVKILGP
ncbi:MAG: hypothetical protein HY434_00440 [Candidatus Liptonbacteria bacterium]|nr:hypothetical protein [Candidatus Liptonbacteria bacterium]